MGSAMVLALKGKELVDGGYCYRISGMNSQGATARFALRAVADPRAACRHDPGPGDGPIMHEPGHGKVPPPERPRDLRHARSDLCHTGGVDTIAHEGDAPAIGQGFE
jgi:hypothetical protein